MRSTHNHLPAERAGDAGGPQAAAGSVPTALLQGTWRPLGKRLGLAIVGSLWLISVCVGMGHLIHYENTPGQAGPHPAEWPASSRIPRGKDGATLVMLVHPRCPCSRASLGELELIMAGQQLGSGGCIGGYQSLRGFRERAGLFKHGAGLLCENLILPRLLGSRFLRKLGQSFVVRRATDHH